MSLDTLGMLTIIGWIIKTPSEKTNILLDVELNHLYTLSVVLDSIFSVSTFRVFYVLSPHSQNYEFSAQL